MQKFKLASVVLDAGDFLAGTPEVLYRAEPGATCAYDDGDGSLEVSGLVDFCTYFNGVPVGKWRRYAAVGAITLQVELKGDACTLCALSLSAADADSPVAQDVVEVIEAEASADYQVVDLPMPPDAVVAGFAVMAHGSIRIRNAAYYAEVDEARIRPVRLALCTTTFRKEEFIIPNIARIKEQVLASDDLIASRFHMFVVDNGRTLDAAALSDGGVTVIPNPNVGGSGGFARGMMAALDDAEGFTHVILMDDDVRMFPESFKRTFALLSLVTDEYADACLNGAMLELERPTLQFEDVSRARKTGGYEKVKPSLRIDRPGELVRNELLDVEVDHAYGAWWYSCIPVSLIERAGLPMPFFVRCDDVEYGVRLDAKYMTMSGICVWHARFDARFNAAVVCYQYARNMMATIALHEFFDERVFMVRYWRMFHIALRSLDYSSADLWLDGFEDYLKGPEFLMDLDGAKMMSQNSQRSEKLVPLEELDPNVIDRLDFDVAWLSRPEGYERSSFQKALVSIPHDRHFFPNFMLSDSPGALAPWESYTPWTKTAMRKTLVALNIDGTHGAVRVMDRERYRKLVNRFSALMRRYRKEGEEVAACWRAKMPEMASREFWADYLERLNVTPLGGLSHHGKPLCASRR